MNSELNLQSFMSALTGNIRTAIESDYRALKNLRQTINDLKREQAYFEKQYDLNSAAQIKYYALPPLENKAKALKQKINEAATKALQEMLNKDTWL